MVFGRARFISQHKELGKLEPEQIDALSFACVPKFFKAMERVYSEA